MKIQLARREDMEKRRYRVTITVGGESYTIRGDTEPERVQKVAAILDERLRQTERTYPSLSPAKIAVLTGLNLTEEFLRLQEDYQQLLAMVKQVR
jgi:cell division protein ZapA